MIVGVMSDTHDRVDLARAAVRTLLGRGAKVIFHLGDVVSPFTLRAILEEARGKAGVTAIYGNNCGEKEGLRKAAEAGGASIAEPPVEVKIDGRKLLLVHGWGPASLTVKIIRALASSGEWDGVLYGHTHTPEVSYRSGVLILNPGEASGVLTGRATVAVLDTSTMKARILRIDSGWKG